MVALKKAEVLQQLEDSMTFGSEKRTKQILQGQIKDLNTTGAKTMVFVQSAMDHNGNQEPR